MWKFTKKYWGLLLALGGFLLGIFFARKGSSSLPTIDKPSEELPTEEKPTDFIGEHKEEKKVSDEKIDDMSRDDLVDDITDKYG